MFALISGVFEVLANLTRVTVPDKCDSVIARTGVQYKFMERFFRVDVLGFYLIPFTWVPVNEL